MKTLFVDCEEQLKTHFEEVTTGIEEIELAGAFCNPVQALEFAKTNKIELAFLDIKMPQMSGLELAKELRNIYPEMIIVFISGYKSFTEDVFRSYVADYCVLKPYTRDDMLAVMKRIHYLACRLKKRVQVQTFGRFEVYVDNKPVYFSNAKARELLAILIDYNGGIVDSELAFSILWENKHYDHMQASAYRRALLDLQNALKNVQAQDILITYPRGRAVQRDKIDCDYFDFLNDDMQAREKYKGEYMSQYSWGEYRIPDLNDILKHKK